MKNFLYLFFSFCILVFLWGAAVSLSNINHILFPSPIEVLSSLNDFSVIATDIISSLSRLAIGCFIGIVTGILFGLLTGHINLADKTVGQVANFFRFVPPLALVPIFLIWFGIGEMSKIYLLAWTAFFPVWISTYNGVQNLEKKYLIVAKSLQVKRFFFIKEVLFKGSTPHILNGVRIGIAIGFSVLVAAEMLGAYSGIGYRIAFLQSVYRIDRMIAYILILGVIGLIIDRLFTYYSRKIASWKNEE